MLVGQDLDQSIEFGVGIGGNLGDMKHVGVKGCNWIAGICIGFVVWRVFWFGSHENE